LTLSRRERIKTRRNSSPAEAKKYDDGAIQTNFILTRKFADDLTQFFERRTAVILSTIRLQRSLNPFV
jgi:hypothetical protein